MRVWLFALILAVAWPGVSQAESPETARIGRIRAALLYYIAKFVALPADEATPLTICRIGEDPLNEYLGSTIAGKSAQSHNLRAVALDESDALQKLSGCDIVFIGTLKVLPRDKVLAAAHALRRLSVCAVADLIWDTCMIQVFEQDNKMRLAVDQAMLDKYGLRASSELLEVAVLRRHST